jgi:hypothetical protein
MSVTLKSHQPVMLGQIVTYADHRWRIWGIIHFKKETRLVLKPA